MAKIIYTHTDEAPLLATYSFLPILQAFTATADIDVQTKDISLAGRILAAFSDRLPAEQQVGDALAELGALAKTPEANILKLPNISASVPQLKAAVAELQSKGFDVPDFPDEPADDDERSVRAVYDKIKGSAVNPVLREGNSDRRVPVAVKNFARKHPHSVAEWSPESKTRVLTLGDHDFRHNEQSVVLPKADDLTVQLVADDGSVTVLKESIPVLEGEVFDATFLSAKALDDFLKESIQQAKDAGVIFSVHLKATMMKVSDPVIFGHVVRAFFPDLFEKYGDALEAAGISANNGLGGVIAGIDSLPEDVREGVREAIEAGYQNGPRLSAVNSDKGISNLHVPSDVIIDASLPALIRNGGRLWDMTGAEDDTFAVIPDSSYAGVYEATIEDAVRNGKFDPTTVGSVPNVGLMAKKAEEYGSHDKTFVIDRPGVVQVLDQAGEALIEQRVEAGDIWRGCQSKDESIRDWVKLAVTRARLSETPVVFWLDDSRAHDRNLIEKVHAYLADLDTEGLDIRVLSPIEATKFTLKRFRAGEDTISASGNVLRDYLTDLFPILEVGTSAKTLSVVPLLAGGGLFETGSGGSAPKHVQQFLAENHLRWDSLGEYLAISESLRFHARKSDSPRAQVLGDALDQATERYLNEDRSPSRKAGEIDDRGSHYYVARFWAENLAQQTDDAELAELFAPVAKALSEGEQQITSDLLAVQGSPVDIGGYYRPDDALASAALRPSAALNEIIDSIGRA
ncbi:NADP-dependent isocitrate dehydrogenase [Pseudoclavibacter sp. CFCC 14310]|uniref:NADP-dependent isocitrate dehydrogenase n=1 Tax=Pseudoclavibacter sp. CFCC 14310 TaxID=2615180 RepID=UPI0013018DE6|nr:NADP-dependent isocitrate dehydrogenase [Pseudoclavibacter sp. CFCC 14310]KAB1645548.1 NADP-dependent isocitrate dehydrogenase [Pseudoclavibacter sp. CFCC 14310]KAB1645993.1 NADP-dependent isocitrate dehydrogenase [Pseudoclavibacter sp. CFCC 14310]